MIILKINGGLGNQMFQYAAGYALSRKHNTSLKLDLTSLTSDGFRKFDLNAFQFQHETASREESDLFLKRNFFDKLRDRLLPTRFRKVYREPFFHFDKKFFSAGPNVYLKGYWQSEKYFLPFNHLIKEQFKFKSDIVAPVQNLARELASVPSASIHIRRGDYTDEILKEYHGLLTEDYYSRAVSCLKKEVKEIRFYIFSDNIAWVKETLPLNDAVFISGKVSQNHYQDLYLMSQCRHNIIANSSFSWWGAWLNNNPDKIVIAPKKWFNKGPKDTYDLIPEGWLTL